MTQKRTNREKIWVMALTLAFFGAGVYALSLPHGTTLRATLLGIAFGGLALLAIRQTWLRTRNGKK